MKNITIIKLGVSLTVLAFYLFAGVSAPAQSTRAALSVNDTDNSSKSEAGNGSTPGIYQDYSNLLGKDTYQPTCATQPTCEELGYTQTEQYCHGVSAANNILKCPFDLTKVFCIANGGDTCEIGSILYEDKKCHTSSNLTPIGIVFDTSKKLAIALDRSKLQYSTKYADFNQAIGEGLHNPDHECYGANLNTDTASGKEITPAFISVAKCMGISVPALEYCNAYSTAGTKAGDWFLANKTELRALNTNRSKIDATLSKLGYQKLSNVQIWTSSQADGADSSEYAWYYLMNEDYDDTNDKQDSLTTIPVLFY